MDPMIIYSHIKDVKDIYCFDRRARVLIKVSNSGNSTNIVFNNVNLNWFFNFIKLLLNLF